MCTCVCACMWRPRADSGVFLGLSPPHSLRQILSPVLELTWLQLTVHLAAGLMSSGGPCLHLWSTGSHPALLALHDKHFPLTLLPLILAERAIPASYEIINTAPSFSSPFGSPLLLSIPAPLMAWSYLLAMFSLPLPLPDRDPSRCRWPCSSSLISTIKPSGQP